LHYLLQLKKKKSVKKKSSSKKTLHLSRKNKNLEKVGIEKNRGDAKEFHYGT